MDDKNENENRIDYKIYPGNVYRVNRNDYKGRAFYNITVTKRDIDGVIVRGNKQIRFRDKEIELEDGTFIKIKRAFEDFYFKANDKFNPIFCLVIMDFEITNDREQEELRNTIRNAYEDFNSNDYLDLPF